MGLKKKKVVVGGWANTKEKFARCLQKNTMCERISQVMKKMGMKKLPSHLHLPLH